MTPHVLVLGAGFGGLEVATRLHELLPGGVRVTLLDARDHFVIGFSKFEVMFGRRTVAEISHPYGRIAAPVDFRRERITAIDPVAKTVTTESGRYTADAIVVALGADVDPSATPGLVEGGHEFYTVAGAERLAPVIASLEAGRVLLGILGAPYKCPPAPFEAALQLHDALVARGVRDRVTLAVASPAPVPLAVTKEGSEVVLRLFAERNITFLPQHLVTHLDPAARIAHVKGGPALPYDLFLGVPVHRVPAVVVDAGLAPAGGWVQVDPATLETRFPGVFAVGDVTAIPAGQGAVPKAGAFADRAAKVVAETLAARLSGRASSARFDAAGSCYLEFGGGAVAKIDANFLGGAAPVVKFLGPSHDFRPDKVAFASTRLARWFRSS